MLGQPMTAQNVIEAYWVREDTQRAMAGVMAEVDLLALPSCPLPAVSIEDGTLAVGDNVFVRERP